MRKTYIGEDTPEQAPRLDQLSDLRAEGFMRIGAATGSLMSAMARAALFRLGGTIVGTHAFRRYESGLGLRYVDRLGRKGDGWLV